MTLEDFRVEDGPLAVRPVRPDDAVHLFRWLNDPRVLAYYEGRDRPQSWARIQSHFLSRSGNPVVGGMVLWENQPVGYLQAYPLQADDLSRYGYCLDEQIFGMDMFIGETARWGMGIGTRLVNACTDTLARFKASRVVLDPRVENARAIHVYQKCGFRIVKRLVQAEYHEGAWHDCWLMERCSAPSRI